MQQFFRHFKFHILSAKLYGTAGVYFVSIFLLRWLVNPSIDSIYFGIGALIGLHMFEVLEHFINTTNQSEQVPKLKSTTLFRTAISQLLVSVLTFFALTSTSSFMGKGLVLFLNLYLLMIQYQAYIQGKLAEWIGEQASSGNQKLYLLFIALLFIIETILFVL